MFTPNYCSIWILVPTYTNVFTKKYSLDVYGHEYYVLARKYLIDFAVKYTNGTLTADLEPVGNEHIEGQSFDYNHPADPDDLLNLDDQLNVYFIFKF